MGQVNAQGEPDNHGAEAMVVDRRSSREIVNHGIDYLVWKWLQSKLSTAEIYFSLDLLPHKIPTLNFDGIHSGAREKEREKPRSHDHPMGGGMLGNYQQNSDIMHLFPV